MEWVPIFYFRLFGEIGGGSNFQKDLFCRNKRNNIPVDTGLGSDNISPKALARLSQSALTALAVLFMALRSWDFGPSRWQFFCNFLIYKAKGVNVDFHASSRFFKRFFHHKFVERHIRAKCLSIHINFLRRI